VRSLCYPLSAIRYLLLFPTMSTEIKVPDLGDFHDVEIIDVLVKPGDTIEIDTPLLTLETEKATLDVPSTEAGVVKSIAVKKGDRVSKGSVILALEADSGSRIADSKKLETPPSTAREDKAAPEESSPVSQQAAPTSAASPSEPTANRQPPTASTLSVPDIGDFKDVEVIDVLVKAGDKIEIDTPLLTLETEKATIDVPATSAGTVKSLAVKKGDRVSKGSPILTLEADSGSRIADSKKAEAPKPAAPEQKPAKVPTSAETQQAAAPPAASSEPTANRQPLTASFSSAHASPSVRRFARELGADLNRIKGTGIKGRITPDDVKSWVKQALSSGAGAAASGGGALPKVPEVDFSKFGEIEVKALGRIQKISGARLQASWLNIPHVWQMDEADITEMEEARGKLKEQAAARGIKLTPLAFILRACVKTLQAFPVANSSLDSSGQNLVQKKYIHLGFAADTPNGLVVPVIRDADKKDIYEIARDLGTLSEKARAGKLSAAEMQGASFTISSLGGIGGTSFTPIINAPEVAILGVARSSMKPVFQKGQFVPRLILPFTFAYDHRVIDGAAGARFTTHLSQQLADVKGLLEAVP
jgi:pyruvate dehydrogenase E2 component (dihydrolipoamide acetyltransferase)